MTAITVNLTKEVVPHTALYSGGDEPGYAPDLPASTPGFVIDEAQRVLDGVDATGCTHMTVAKRCDLGL